MRVPPASILLIAFASAAGAQGLRPISRADAIAAAASTGTRSRLALTDSAAANALARVASAYPNPALAASYSKAIPQYHLSLDQPIEYPWLRSARSDAAEEFRRASTFRYLIERTALEVEADTAYTTALAAAAHARLSQRSAQDADSLLTLARLRRDAGDASELEVELAALGAGQAENASATDSLAALGSVLDLQRFMGLPADQLQITLTDSIASLPAAPGTPPAAGDSAVVPLIVAEAQATAAGAERALAVESRSIFSTPSIMVGFDTHDPTGSEPGILPTFGITLPLPLWDWRGGQKAAAQAELTRAQAELAFARRESDARIAEARRQLEATRTRAMRDEKLLASARRVAAMSLTAYAEGAAPIATVLEAQRTARDAFGRWVDDLAAAQNAAALLRLHTLTASVP